LPSFLFQLQGLAPVLDTGLARRPFSVMTLTSHFVKNTVPIFPTSTYHLLVGFLLFVFIMPLLHFLICLALCFLRLTRRQRYFWLIAAEITFAWAAMDVYVLSVTAAIFQIERFAQFIMGDKCDGVDQLLKQAYSDFLGGHGTCFHVVPEPGPGLWILLVSCVLFNVAGRMVMEKTKLSITEGKADHATEDAKEAEVRA